MMIHIEMQTRDKLAHAQGIYTPDKTVVLAGGKIHPSFKGEKRVQEKRTNREYVNSEGMIIKDCEFASPSEAAQFVNGNISNGLRVWKVDGINLGIYLKKNGLR